ncbi:heme o synthase [Aeoliella mucimassa]|uniref:Protoheme IX farnesyltransferase n=1 Tax=Aeoliella mucimassa TaxID=2527972 RepID=A0A518AKA2_9BACT|nr:heme o synthase [Aeoliella mucimassa]QDU55145.1 Protoheme IX farnesyltransferase 2 [Aeoliella mucimassa]
MSTPTTTGVMTDRVAWTSRFADFWELTKPRIVAMELITIAMGFYLAAGSQWSPLVLVATLLGTGLVAGSASTLNMWLERDLDAMMVRTANRPLPAGRVVPWHAVVYGLLLLAGGVALLAIGPGAPTLTLGLICWCLYVVIYTPLKTRSTLNTAVGAASGSLPIVMGWVAAGGKLDWVGCALFGVLYLWQYPHFMAIAWRCKDDYQRGGYVMSTTVDPSGRRAGQLAIIGSLLLIPVSLVPIMVSDSMLLSSAYAIWCVLLAGVYLWASVVFARSPGDVSSRLLLRASLIYLPCWILGLFLVAI